MNKLAVISAFLGGVKNRYMQYQEDRTLREKFEIAGKIKGLDGLELCYPADFKDVPELRKLLADYGFGVPSVNMRTRREGRWLRGSVSSQSEQERKEVVEDAWKAMDLAREIGSSRVSTCPLNDGHDYVFEMNYLDAYRFAEESFAKICGHDPGMKVCIEYKWNDPRTRCLLGSAGETLSFCQSVGVDNLGVTMDIGHSLLSGERPAQALVMLHRAGKMFYVHLNDNDRAWDWDMLPGAYHVNEFIEFFYYLKKIGYTDDWYAYDVMSKEVDTIRHFNLVTKLTRKLEEMTARIDVKKMDALMQERNPVDSIEYLYDSVY